ncbi:hypothetical protein [Amorphus sp. 3PC139-8]|uniref:hypothetical protein n=1 Tax=Amorphus sp. 3PC139-8 TaxID=2735676 RepID=UPI00345CE444
MSTLNIKTSTRARAYGGSLTEDDHAVLHRLAGGGEAFSERYQQLLAAKLRSCIVYPAGGIPEDVVRLNTCFTYAIDGNLKEASILVRHPPADLPPFALSLHTMRGLALLGLSEGECVELGAAGGASETIELVRILRQPRD